MLFSPQETDIPKSKETIMKKGSRTSQVFTQKGRTREKKRKVGMGKQFRVLNSVPNTSKAQGSSLCVL